MIPSLLLLALVAASQSDVGKPVKVSYYGDECRGRPTASGQTFNPDKLTAAALTFRAGNKPYYISVTKGSKTIRVLVNDRLPYKYYLAHHVSYDLSRAAFEQLSPLSDGITVVSVTTTTN